jgi:Holliday junction DNA helicase RuvA
MIAHLSGILLSKDSTSLIIDVQGVGYEVHVSSRTCDSLPPGEKVSLHIHTSVREDAITLYGFQDSSQKHLFLLLNTVSGVGPKLALAILSGMEPAELRNAISLKDIKRLTALPGVGKKTAERLCMELADKIAAFALEHGCPLPKRGSPPPVSEGFAMQDAASALSNLGYPQETAWQALRTVQQADPAKAAAMNVSELIRAALMTLARA